MRDLTQSWRRSRRGLPLSFPIWRLESDGLHANGEGADADWVADGAALIGDAAHAMNPHASQGRMQAMVDAMTLAEIIPACLADGDYSAATIKRYERRDDNK